MKSALLVSAGVLMVAQLAVPPVHAGPPVSVTIDLFGQVVDEQDLNAYYGTSGSCPGSAAAIDVARLAGDSAPGPSAAYGFGPPWTLVQGLVSAAYVNGADCQPGSNVCLGVKLNHTRKTLSLDTRGTLGPRAVSLDFSNPCFSCGLAGDSGVFGSSLLTTPALISVFADTPFTDMAVCSSTACLEAQPAFARLWFGDPGGDPNVNWRVDWGYLRILRLANNTWYVLADGCDGSQVAALSRIHKNRRRLIGNYLMPFFLSALQ